MSMSNLKQFQFIWTVIQPAMHRDFMYTAKKEFPDQDFAPISIHATRKLKVLWTELLFLAAVKLNITFIIIAVDLVTSNQVVYKCSHQRYVSRI